MNNAGNAYLACAHEPHYETWRQYRDFRGEMRTRVEGYCKHCHIWLVVDQAGDNPQLINGV